MKNSSLQEIIQYATATVNLCSHCYLLVCVRLILRRDLQFYAFKLQHCWLSERRSIWPSCTKASSLEDLPGTWSNLE